MTTYNKFGIAAVVLAVIGLVFKTMSWPGASIAFIISMFLLVAFFAPMRLMQLWNNGTPKYFAIAEFIALVLFSLATIFKIQHWPGGSMLLAALGFVFLLLYIPAFIYKLKKTSDSKESRHFSIVVGAMMLIMFLQYSSGQMSKGFLNSFDMTIVKQLELLEKNQNRSTKLSDALAQIGDKEYEEKATEIREQSIELINYTDSLINVFISEANGISWETADTLFIGHVQKRDNPEITTRILIDEGEATTLKSKLDQYSQLIFNQFSADKQLILNSELTIDTKDRFDTDEDRVISWEKHLFDRVPLSISIGSLVAIQNDISLTENAALAELLNEAAAQNQENFSAVLAEINAKNEAARMAQEILILEKDKALSEARINERDQKLESMSSTLVWLILGLVLFSVMLYYVIRSNFARKRLNKEILHQKNEIEHQKQAVEFQHQQLEEKNREITDSITYAKRIQEAILPPARLVKEYLNESFILYKPKDIVAGDFYWMQSVLKSSPPHQGGVPAGGGGLKINNIPKLKTFRKELRNNLTPAEAKLWSLVQKSQLEGRKFRRQHSVGLYILDFYCPSEKLAIELDGQGHFNASQAEYDQERTDFLNSFGINVIRFENKFVFEQTEMVLEAIKHEFGWEEKQPPRPADTPPLQGGEQELVIFAAADCTGHGVPGAMVSVVCHNALNRAVREFGLTEPAKILDKTLEIVIEQFNKSEEEVKDGMDIALCALNTKTNELQYAGAHNPLWLVTRRKSKVVSEEEENSYDLRLTTPIWLHEVKADKQPIGKYTDQKPFTNHLIQLEPGDSIYIFSDGYADQFGGPKGKKFKYSTFKELILSLQHKSMSEQKDEIAQHFETWRGELEQIDDVCVIGVKIT